MKRVFALMMVLLLALSLVACGNGDGPQAGNTTGTQASTQPSTNASTQAATGNQPAFDTGWAKNDFEALLPELPFAGWSTSQVDGNTYKMELSGLNTSAATNPPESGEPDGADKTKLKNYLASLSGYGFTVEETGTDYRWLVTDAQGNEMEFMCGDGYCGITIQKAA